MELTGSRNKFLPVQERCVQLIGSTVRNDVRKEIAKVVVWVVRRVLYLY